MHFKITMISVLLAGYSPASTVAQQKLPGHPSLAYWTVSALDSTASRVFVVVHGGPGVTHDYLRPELDQFAVWGDVVYYDQRGCGGSGYASSFNWSDHVDDLHRVVEATQGDRDVVLVGSSWGSFLIDYYLLTHPGGIEAVILSGMSPGGMVPAEIEDRLTDCWEVTRATREGMAGAPYGIGSVETYRLKFVDSGEAGRTITDLYGAFRRWFVTLPSHDPWFSRRREYFSTVGEFLLKVDGR